jgi:C4-dicarboxylate-specific signal transduction histidine kinase
VHFKQPTFWETYGHIALIALGVMLLQTGLIVALLYERRLQKRTAAALEASERRMVLAARTARLSNWVWDVDHGRANGTASIQVPHTPASKEPPAIDFERVLEITHPADREALKRAVQQAVATDDELNIEYRVVQPNEVRWFAARGRLDQADPRRLRGVAIDITQRKVAELQAEQDRTALGHMTRVSLLGQLSASIAHQLNQPLAAILSNAEAAQKMLRRDGLDLEELRAICDDIVTEDNRASQVIRRLGALYKRGDRELQPVDINELMRETLGLLHTDLVTRQITVTTQFSPSIEPVEGERVQLQQVFMNLIVNAADAMGAEPESERRVSIRTEKIGAAVQIDVADAGLGIPEDALDRMFDMFWTTKAGGMGIGLAICRTIIAAHGGTLVAANNPQPGKGATLRITLPARAA